MPERDANQLAADVRAASRDRPIWWSAYRFSPDQWPRRRQLEAARRQRRLTLEEREELRWLVQSHTNWLLDGAVS